MLDVRIALNVKSESRSLQQHGPNAFIVKLQSSNDKATDEALEPDGNNIRNQNSSVCWLTVMEDLSSHTRFHNHQVNRVKHLTARGFNDHKVHRGIHLIAPGFHDRKVHRGKHLMLERKS